MNLFGALANGLAASGGAFVGLTFRSRISEDLGTFLMKGMGLCVILVAVEGMMRDASVVTITLSVALGGALGHAFDLDALISRFGSWVEQKLGPAAPAEQKAASPGFARGFVSSTLFICVGSMAIVGSLEAGLEGDASTLFAKSLIDCVVCMLMAATLGSGTVASGLCVFAYEAVLTILAGAVAPYPSDATISQMLVTGSLLLLAIAFDMMDICHIKTAYLLPAAFLPLVLYPLISLVPALA